MKSLIMMAVILLLMLSCTTVVHVDKAVEDIAWNTLEMISPEEQPVIAVYHLRNLSDNDEVNQLLVTRLTTELANAARYNERDLIVVSRQTFDEIFEEQNFILSDLADQGKQIEIGKLLGADLILTGDLSLLRDLSLQEGNVFNINTQLIDTETGEILGGNTFDFWVNIPEN